MKYPAALVIWVLFWMAGIVAPLVALVRALLTLSADPISHTFHAQNRVAATVLGFKGKLTISSECGLSDCSWCKRLCSVLSFVLQHPNHCEEEAKNKR